MTRPNNPNQVRLVRHRNSPYTFGVNLHVEPLWCAWFSGLVDGEGSFEITKQSRMGNDGYLRDECKVRFRITMRGDEKKYIEEIADVLKCGSIRDDKKTRIQGTGYVRRPICTWEVTAVGSLVDIIVPLLDKYPLRMKKSQDYIIWRRAAFLIYEGGHLNGRGDELLELNRQLREVRRYRDE